VFNLNCAQPHSFGTTNAPSPTQPSAQLKAPRDCPAEIARLVTQLSHAQSLDSNDMTRNHLRRRYWPDSSPSTILVAPQ
jgi:hypothetical protein